MVLPGGVHGLTPQGIGARRGQRRRGFAVAHRGAALRAGRRVARLEAHGTVALTLEQKITQLESLVAGDPEDYTGHFLLGKLYLDAGRFAEGAACFERSFALKPDYSAAYRFAGDCHRKAGDGAAARARYTEGIAVAERVGDLQTAKEMHAFLRRMDSPS